MQYSYNSLSPEITCDTPHFYHEYNGGVGAFYYIQPPTSIISASGDLTSITLPRSIVSINGAFASCANLVEFKGELASEDGRLVIANKILLAVTPAGLTEFTTTSDICAIDNGAFLNYTTLTGVIISDSVTSIGANAFSGCSSLNSITIPNSVTSIGSNAFEGCKGKLVIDSNALGSYGGLFSEIIIGDSVTSIGANAFSGCSSLSSITIPNKITSIGASAFSGCSNLSSITIPSGVKSIGDRAFSDCSSLSSITIPSSVASFGVRPFSGCKGKITINCNIPESPGGDDTRGILYESQFTELIIGDRVTSIGDFALYGCSSLKSVTIGNSVTYISQGAFGMCCELESITIPSSVTYVGAIAFRGCSKLKSVYCKPATPPTGDVYMFDNNASERKIYVPRNSVSAYQAASYWSDYASYIVGYDFE